MGNCPSTLQLQLWTRYDQLNRPGQNKDIASLRFLKVNWSCHRTCCEGGRPTETLAPLCFARCDQLDPVGCWDHWDAQKSSPIGLPDLVQGCTRRFCGGPHWRTNTANSGRNIHNYPQLSTTIHNSISIKLFLCQDFRDMSPNSLWNTTTHASRAFRACRGVFRESSATCLGNPQRSDLPFGLTFSAPKPMGWGNYAVVDRRSKTVVMFSRVYDKVNHRLCREEAGTVELKTKEMILLLSAFRALADFFVHEIALTKPAAVWRAVQGPVSPLQLKDSPLPCARCNLCTAWYKSIADCGEQWENFGSAVQGQKQRFWSLSQIVCWDSDCFFYQAVPGWATVVGNAGTVYLQAGKFSIFQFVLEKNRFSRWPESVNDMEKG